MPDIVRELPGSQDAVYECLRWPKADYIVAACAGCCSLLPDRARMLHGRLELVKQRDAWGSHYLIKIIRRTVGQGCRQGGGRGAGLLAGHASDGCRLAGM